MADKPEVTELDADIATFATGVRLTHTEDEFIREEQASRRLA